MRLISLLLTLVIISALIFYYSDSMLSTKGKPGQTILEQKQQVLDEAKRATEKMQKALEEQQQRFKELEEKQK